MVRLHRERRTRFPLLICLIITLLLTATFSWGGKSGSLSRAYFTELHRIDGSVSTEVLLGGTVFCDYEPFVTEEQPLNDASFASAVTGRSGAKELLLTVWLTFFFAGILFFKPVLYCRRIGAEGHPYAKRRTLDFIHAKDGQK